MTEQNSLIRSRTVSQLVLRPADEVYAFASDPDNLPAWAAGLVNGTVTSDGDALVLESPMGRISVRFVPHNEFGVLDHDVTLPSGATTNNPFRVIPHPNGAELLFTVRQVDLTDDEFERDIQAVAADLARLALILDA
jgi:hypothetical protein